MLISHNLCNKKSSTVRKYRHDQPANEIICDHECNFTPFLYSCTSKYQTFVWRCIVLILSFTSYTFTYIRLFRPKRLYLEQIRSIFLGTLSHLSIYPKALHFFYVTVGCVLHCLTYNRIVAITALNKKIAFRNLFRSYFLVEINSNLFKHNTIVRT
jgi:hypothetical protein